MPLSLPLVLVQCLYLVFTLHRLIFHCLRGSILGRIQRKVHMEYDLGQESL